MCKVFHSSESSLVIDVKFKQYLDPLLMKLKESVISKAIETYSQGENKVLRYQGRLRVPDIDGLKGIILEKAHASRYSIHWGATKMYHDLQEIYWWNGIKRDIMDLWLNVQILNKSKPSIKGWEAYP